MSDVHAWACVGNPSALGAVVLTVLGVLPVVIGIIAGLLAVIWYGLEIIESEPFKRWQLRRQKRKEAEK